MPKYDLTQKELSLASFMGITILQTKTRKEYDLVVGKLLELSKPSKELNRFLKKAANLASQLRRYRTIARKIQWIYDTMSVEKDGTLYELMWWTCKNYEYSQAIKAKCRC
jgi:hypothetical protein